MNLLVLIQQIATAPSPAVLWELYGYLLAAGADPALLKMAETFHHYL